VYRQPLGTDYAERLVIRRGDSASPVALPDLQLAAADVLGPAEAAQSAG
jgi:hypothetical protein